MSKQSRQFIRNKMATPPTSVTICLAASIGASVSVCCNAVTSFITRDINSPVRRRAKKLSDSDWRWVKR